jgi:MFS family permease
MDETSEEQRQQDIINKIKSGKVEMHSKAYLVWRNTFWILAICLLAAAAVFFLSFLVFIIRVNHLWDLPDFGYHGLREFLTFFPWLFVPAILLFTWLVERFVRQHSFAYRVPVLYVGLVSMVLVISASFAVLATPLHLRLYESAEGEHLPVVGYMYRFFGGMHPDDYYVGQVQTVKDDDCLLLTQQGFPVNIITNPHTQLFGATSLNPGDTIEVVGEERGNIVEASEIREISPEIPPPNMSPPPENMLLK